LNEFIIVLRRSILDWEETMRGKLNNPYFDAYEELALLVGIHPQTLRKYVNQFKPTYPTLETLYAICNAIKDTKPVQFYYDYIMEAVGK